MANFLDGDIIRTVEIAWCPSHCNIRGNDRADELAKGATQLSWGAPIGTSRAFALRRAKATTQTAWRIYVQRHTPQKGIRLILDTVSRMRGPATQFDTSQLGGVTNAVSHVTSRHCLSLLTTPTKRNEHPPQPSTIGHEDHHLDRRLTTRAH